MSPTRTMSKVPQESGRRRRKSKAVLSIIKSALFQPLAGFSSSQRFRDLKFEIRLKVFGAELKFRLLESLEHS
ncbi:hypothetical protein CEXT_130151 [Caerostris extrusa]|uniref:Ribosomal protein L32 n=1 Tax=Caerostris extrusa TaxID=172846 RepID=A0AAV4VZM3_CAEEX|nr:hypothetical protein CEXT_130151 [Caerostris extrusa]